MNKSQELFKQAKLHIPGGVNSPVRAFRAVEGDPVFFKKGCGAYAFDVDDNKYIDYIGSWGPLILGHAHPHVIKEVQKTLVNGLSFGAPNELETTLSIKIKSFLPAIEKIRMVNSGTEATMTAIRLARAFTNKNKIIKFNGCYHGHNDSLLIKGGSGILTLGIPSTPGIPDSITQHTLCAEFNDISSVAKLFTEFSGDVAAIIVEPIAGNMGFIKAQQGFLEELADLCKKNQALLIFDEVMTGFRVHRHSAQGLYKITPDITTLGKVIGGGMPVGAIGGSKEIMDSLAPDGDVYQAGTLSGNPIAMQAGLATLEVIENDPEFYQRLENSSKKLIIGLKKAAEENNIKFCADYAGGMFGFFFTDYVKNFADVAAADSERFKSFHHQALKKGLYFAPSAFEAGFMSIAHSDADIEKTIDIATEIFKNLALEQQ